MRIRYLSISTELLVKMLTDGNTIHAVVTCGLPADTRCVRAGLTAYGMVNLIIESREFDDIAEFDEIPQQPKPRLTTLTLPAA